ncbi:bifunctional demethylmenaquinone methyltransferase/2-methoxy-6-polyprenyl-1,4-benzoquinol methylase UbiE [Bacteriovorax sp. DB6_IX]|uniref:bifunctional demethylmenaquinone methyltransferase/2-methoxy-6-polyprenyl-1,4-benzoquinol methylase UbiE n=1 Tax=Bacteriovorax sp. DB6_IX TaxID=1353530 RepID=UPI000389F157|nr:bifunctional demethylmenaquinone methyltransferase/2-methoxy-6-polyprenyl-1,4-benzoquinol methylase UbiE [Bacteriovorax sp. DB6_IX]EQC49799.1 ubiquinone/menaquinone biosynthesis methyltransferase [Bacteriovorax sp. DB6_IX]
MSNQLAERKTESYKIFDKIAGTYDFLNHLLSFGIDIYWRKKVIKNLPPRKNLQCLDLACGTGDLTIVLAKQDSVEKVTGLDMSKGMVDIGKIKIDKKGYAHKAAMQIGDGVEIPTADELFDVTTVSFGIRNFPDPQRSLENMFRVIKPGGRSMVLEFSIPKNPLFKGIYFFYFRYLLPFVGNLISKHKDAYSYLNETVEDFPYGQDFADMMVKAGFKNVRYEELTFGIATLYIGEK